MRPLTNKTHKSSLLKKKSYKSFNIWELCCQYSPFTFSFAKKKSPKREKDHPVCTATLILLPGPEFNSVQPTVADSFLLQSCLLPFSLKFIAHPLTAPSPTVSPAVIFTLLIVLSSVVFWQITCCLHVYCPKLFLHPVYIDTMNLRWHLVTVDVKKHQLNEVI